MKIANMFYLIAWEHKLLAQIYEAEGMLEDLLEKRKINQDTYFQLKRECKEVFNKVVDKSTSLCDNIY